MTPHPMPVELALARMGAIERRAAERRLVRELRAARRRERHARSAASTRSLLASDGDRDAGDYRARPRAARSLGGQPRP